MNKVGAITYQEFLWQLPLFDAYDREHMALLMEGIRTQWPEAKQEEKQQEAETMAKLRALRLRAES